MISVVILGINDIGERILDWLENRNDTTVLAVIKRKDELKRIHDLEPDLLVSAGFRHIVPDEILTVPTRGAINLHKSYLPYNRGANPNVWSILEDNPAGVSIHYMTAEVDAGPLINRRKVPVYPDDTGRDLYERLEAAQFNQFTDVWPAIRDESVETTEQDPTTGTYHYKADFVDLWELDRDEQTTVGSLIDRLRALTFPPYKNAYFEVDGEKYHVEIDITPAEATTNKNKNIPNYDEDDFN